MKQLGRNPQSFKLIASKQVLKDYMSLLEQGVRSGTEIIMVDVEVSGCFHENTKVGLNDGTTKRIADVREGDVLKSYNISNGMFEESLVTHVNKVEVSRTIEIEFPNRRIVHCTP